MFLKSKFLGVALATCVAVGAYANTCEQREKLGRASAELGFIIGMMDSDLFNDAFLLSLYSPYDRTSFFKKSERETKSSFCQKGLGVERNKHSQRRKNGFPSL